jgi:hypothetical protein
MMLRSLGAFALLTQSALAPHSTLYSDGIPPARFQKDGVAVVLFVSPDGIDGLCGKAGPGRVMLACTNWTAKGVAIVTLPNPCPRADKEYFARIACHELGHVGGWPATHGD